MEKINESHVLLRKARNHLFFSLGSIYITFALLICADYLSKFNSNIHVVETLGIFYMLGFYLVTPISLISLFYVLFSNRAKFQGENKIIGEIPMFIIVISLVVIAYIFGMLTT